MKKLFYITLLLVFLTNCKSGENEPAAQTTCVKEKEVFQNEKGTILNLDKQVWFLKVNSIGGIDVGVKLSGDIVGDSIKVRTYGDGLISDFKIPLDKGKKFNSEIGLFFTSGAPKEENIIAKTLIIVFNKRDTLETSISSLPLKNLLYKK